SPYPTPYSPSLTTLFRSVLPQLLAKLYEALPDAHIDMYIANTQEVVGEVEQLNIDIALVEGMPRPTDMKVIEQRAWLTDTLIVRSEEHTSDLQSRLDHVC